MNNEIEKRIEEINKLTPKKLVKKLDESSPEERKLIGEAMLYQLNRATGVINKE